MSIKDAYFLLSPDELDGENIENHHIFDGAYNTTTNGWAIQNSPSRCGKVKKSDKKIHPTEKDISEKRFCRTLVQGHKKDYNVCGACMATFFSDDDNDS